MNAPSPKPRPALADPVLLRELHGSIALLTLNRPAARNALSEALIAALHTEIEAIGADTAVRAVVIAANGPAFSAGHDLKELTARRSDADRGRGYFQHIMTSCSAMMQAIVHCPKPVIAAVNGIATAAGCQLVATCDLAVASATARFATPGVDIGLFCSTPMVALTRNVPRKQAMEILLTGEPIPADRAREIGLINRVVAEGTRAGRGHRARQPDRSQVDAYGQDRQDRILSASRDEPRRGLRLRERGDDRKHDGARCDRGHFGDHREAQAALGRQVSQLMNHDTYEDGYIRTILRSVRSMAIVGASPNTVRPSYFLFKYMLERGYDVIPVNPGQAGKQMLGRTFVASLGEIGRPVDMIDIFRASAHVMPVVDQALSLIPPPRVIWMQLGVRNDAAAAKIEAAGIKVVMNRCPKIEYGRLSSEISWMGVNSRTLSSKRAPVPVKGVQRLSLDRQSFGGGSTDAADRARATRTGRVLGLVAWI